MVGTLAIPAPTGQCRVDITEKKPAASCRGTPCSPPPLSLTLPPNGASFCLLQKVKSMEEFQKVHARYIKLGLNRDHHHGRDLLAACCLADWATTTAASNSISYAVGIFADLGNDRVAFEYNTLMRGFIRIGDPAAALKLYVDMLERGVPPDNFTFTFLLKASTLHLSFGRQVYGHAVKRGFAASDGFVKNSVMNMFGQSGDLVSCRRAFGQLGPDMTVPSWNTLMAALCRDSRWMECIATLSDMVSHGFSPDEKTLATALSACAHLGTYDIGRTIHCRLLRILAGLDVVTLTSLIDMYCKCGCVATAINVFDGMASGERNACTYGAMISGLAMHGDYEGTLKMFSIMARNGHRPDEAAFVGVLSACSRAGMVEEGLRHFAGMRLEHGVVPSAQHYGCMVDLMARAGKLEEAHELVAHVPVEVESSTGSAWRSLLTGCKIHRNRELANRCLEKLEEMGAVNGGDYVIVADMLAQEGRSEEAGKCRAEAVDRGHRQMPGYSSVEIKGRVWTFLSGDRRHPQSDEIYEMLYQMEWQLRFEGYRRDIPDDVLRQGNSQKLAIAFALRSTSEGTPVRVMTNLRMSRECHGFVGMVSKVFEREIAVRDRNRFHCFNDGHCSCNGYW